KLEEKLNDYTNNRHIIKFSENPFAILIVTPITQRAHTLAFSKDIVFVDSTSSCDTQSHSVTFMLTSCSIGAVPLGMFITKGQTTDDYKVAFGSHF
ncbi:SWIM-type domain-containing protein, partial [Aphis craccivora]